MASESNEVLSISLHTYKYHYGYYINCVMLYGRGMSIVQNINNIEVSGYLLLINPAGTKSYPGRFKLLDI